jgi:hypothetical protein
MMLLQPDLLNDKLRNVNLPKILFAELYKDKHGRIANELTSRNSLTTFSQESIFVNLFRAKSFWAVVILQITMYVRTNYH